MRVICLVVVLELKNIANALLVLMQVVRAKKRVAYHRVPSIGVMIVVLAMFDQPVVNADVLGNVCNTPGIT